MCPCYVCSIHPLTNSKIIYLTHLSTLSIYPLSFLLFSILEHRLYRNEQAHGRKNQEYESLSRSEELAEKVPDAVDTDGEAYQVGRHHHEYVDDTSKGTDVAVPPFGGVLRRTNEV